MLEWVATQRSRASSQPRDETHFAVSPALQVDSLPTEPLVSYAQAGWLKQHKSI